MTGHEPIFFVTIGNQPRVQNLQGSVTATIPVELSRNNYPFRESAIKGCSASLTIKFLSLRDHNVETLSTQTMEFSETGGIEEVIVSFPSPGQYILRGNLIVNNRDTVLEDSGETYSKYLNLRGGQVLAETYIEFSERRDLEMTQRGTAHRYSRFQRIPGG